MEIRLLKASEIEIRVGSVKANGLSLLLYKDARCDMKILDELFGWDGWKREHTLIDGKLFCTVSVWSEKLNQWITKQDVGTESNAEKEKGQASDSFKRACFNLGIGRELYTSPFIWVNGYEKYEKFKVVEIGYNEDKEINRLVIVDSKGKEAYRMGSKAINKPKADTEIKVNTQSMETEIAITDTGLISEKQAYRFRNTIAKNKKSTDVVAILNKYKFKTADDITKAKYNDICKEIEALPNK